MRSPRWSRGALIGVFLVGWCAAVAVPPAMFVRWREHRLAALADPATQAGWEAFREDMRRQSGGAGPVQRKVPRSPEPPERVWLRDYPALAVGAWITFAGVMGAVLGMLLFGSLVAGAGGAASPAEDQPSRQGDDQEQDDGDAEHADEGIHGSPPHATGGGRDRRTPSPRGM